MDGTAVSCLFPDQIANHLDDGWPGTKHLCGQYALENQAIQKNHISDSCSRANLQHRLYPAQRFEPISWQAPDRVSEMLVVVMNIVTQRDYGDNFVPMLHETSGHCGNITCRAAMIGREDARHKKYSH